MLPTHLHGRLQHAAQTNANGVAVVDRDRQMTYGELDAASDELAAHLESLGVQRHDRVAFYMEKSLEAIVGLYAAMKAGAAYVPLDPSAPPKRVAYILRNAGVKRLLSVSAMAKSWLDLEEEGAGLKSVSVLDQEAQSMGRLEIYGPGDIRSAGDLERRKVLDEDLAYILYTSGSTGEPKGVMLSHRNALTFVDWTVDHFGLGPEDRISNHAPLHFDLSVFDLYAACSVGAPVVLVPPQMSVFPSELVRFIEEERLTVWYSVPSILIAMLQRGGLKEGSFPELRTLLFAGEVFPTKHLRALMKALPHVRFSNLYGPTETNVCTYYDVPALDDRGDEPIPIGVPIDNDEVFVVGPDGRELPEGETGELLVRGGTVMQGYWDDVERTQKVLIPNPFRPSPFDRVYRTGDLVRWQHGVLEFFGRVDHQIKSRGYRIEMGEIESALNAHPLVVEAAVIAVPDEAISNRIEAFVVADGELEITELLRFCGERVPHYMLPEKIHVLGDMPRTSTGKISRRDLMQLRNS